MAYVLRPSGRLPMEASPATHCAACHLALHEHTLAETRQVFELPELTMRTVEHRQMRSTPSRHTSPRRADHRCGMTATRRRMRACTLSPIGIWRRNLRSAYPVHR